MIAIASPAQPRRVVPPHVLHAARLVREELAAARQARRLGLPAPMADAAACYERAAMSVFFANPALSDAYSVAAGMFRSRSLRSAR
jgi:hypothetical protein